MAQFNPIIGQAVDAANKIITDANKVAANIAGFSAMDVIDDIVFKRPFTGKFEPNAAYMFSDPIIAAEAYKSIIPERKFRPFITNKPSEPETQIPFNPNITPTQTNGVNGYYTDITDLQFLYQNGKPISTTLKLNGKTHKGTAYYSSLDKDGNVTLVSIAQDLYLDKVLLEIKQNKNVVETKIMGRDFTIKEYIGMDDYSINIEGYILSDINGVYPVEEVKLLKQYSVLKTPIWVTNPILNEVFGINYILIKDVDFQDEAGSISYQKFSISAVNDNLYDTDIINNIYDA